MLDIGTTVETTPGARIVVHGRLSERAPQIVDFLKLITADDEVFDSAAARITGGRIGINPNVAALIVLKNHEDLWTQWVPAEIVERVKGAIAAGKERPQEPQVRTHRRRRHDAELPRVDG